MQRITGFLNKSSEADAKSEAASQVARAVSTYRASLFACRPMHISVVIFGSDEAAVRATEKSVSAQDYPYKSTHLFGEPLSRDTEYVLPLNAGDTLIERALTAFAAEIAAPAPPTHGAMGESIFVFADELIGSKWVKKQEYSEINALTDPDILSTPFVARLDIFADALHQIECNDAQNIALETLAGQAAKLSSRRVHIPLPLASSRVKKANKTPPKSAQNNLYLTKGFYVGSFRARRKDAHNQRVVAVMPLSAEYGDIGELRTLLESLEECGMHDRLQTHIVTSPLATLKQERYCSILQTNGAARHIRSEKTSLAALMNDGARAAEADALLFILPGLEAISPELIQCLLDGLALPNAALCAPKLLNADGSIFSAGEAVRKCDQPDINELYSYIFSPFAGVKDLPGAGDKSLFTMRQVSIVSGECVLVSREAFFDAGGFDETLEKGFVAEMCLRLFRRNRACVFTPYAKLICRREKENISACANSSRLRLMDTLRPIIVKGDPFYREKTEN